MFIKLNKFFLYFFLGFEFDTSQREVPDWCLYYFSFSSLTSPSKSKTSHITLCTNKLIRY